VCKKFKNKKLNYINMEIQFELPSKNSFTVYSKSGCPNCFKVKNLLKERNLLFNIIDCDDYILGEKQSFLNFIKNLSNKEISVFPIIFYESKIVGGFIETKEFIEKLLLLFDNNF
jgi:glutaredoxin